MATIMEWFDALNLARLQFAFTVAFHIIFPAFTIGLASYLFVLNGMHYVTRNRVYMDLFNYWKKIFALSFGMGVVSGIVMSYQFGTNWSVFADKVGPILGPIIGYEVLSAFFLEAGFLGVMLFGRQRVGERLHLFACGMVALGTFASTFWILSVNSWMQTPAGHAINEVGQFIPVDWFQVLFNPSFPHRFAHMVLAAYLTTAFVVAGVAAYHMLKLRRAGSVPTGVSLPAVKKMFSMAMWLVAIVIPLQIYAGDSQGLNTLEHQPVKIAAMEGHFKSEKPAGLVLFGIPNQEEARMDYKLEIPLLGSLILRHDLDGEILGYDAFPREDWPPMAPVFFAFRIMVGIGFLMLGVGLWSLWLRRRKQLYESSLFHKACLLMAPSGFVAVISGWVVTEVGRQPFTVYGLLRTADSVSPIDAPAVAASLIAFIIVYFTLFGAGLVYILRQMRVPPMESETVLPANVPTRAAGFVPPSIVTKPTAQGAGDD
jgi:cytochrome bd ubiquinol oxidase subunit I